MYKIKGATGDEDGVSLIYVQYITNWMDYSPAYNNVFLAFWLFVC
jgi:hypothetical protein